MWVSNSNCNECPISLISAILQCKDVHDNVIQETIWKSHDRRVTGHIRHRKFVPCNHFLCVGRKSNNCTRREDFTHKLRSPPSIVSRNISPIVEVPLKSSRNQLIVLFLSFWQEQSRYSTIIYNLHESREREREQAFDRMYVGSFIGQHHHHHHHPHYCSTYKIETYAFNF